MLLSLMWLALYRVLWEFLMTLSKIHCPGKHCRNNLKKWDHTSMIVQFKSLAWGLPLQISLYFKEINELLLWSGSVWTSFTLKVFCGTVCNEVQWVFFFPRLSSIAFLSLLIWLVFLLHYWSAQLKEKLWSRAKPCLTVPCINAIHLLFLFSL